MYKQFIFLLVFAITAVAADYSLTLNMHYLANPEANLEVSGTYSLEIDTIDFSIKVQKNGGSEAPIDSNNINKSAKTFSWRVPEDLTSDGSYEYIFRLTVAGEEKAADTLRILIDKTKPKVVSVDYSPEYLSITQNTVTITITFDEPISPAGGEIIIKNPTGIDSLKIDSFNQGSDLTKVSADIKSSDFNDYSNWQGNTTLTISQFADTLSNIMETDASQNGPVIDLVRPTIAGISVVPDTVNAKTENVTINVNFNENMDVSEAGKIKLQNNSGDTLSYENPEFSNNITARYVLSNSDLNKIQGTSFLLVSGFADEHKNPVTEKRFNSALVVDTHAPQPPQITSGNNNSIENGNSITISGKKEKKATVYVGGAKASGDISGTSWSYEASIPLDSFYVFTFIQVDSVGNSSGSVQFNVLADHSAPQLKFIPPRLVRSRKDSSSDSLCFKLDLYFDEQVVYQGNGVHLSSGSETLDLQYPFTSQGALQSTCISKESDVAAINTWIAGKKTITVTTDMGAFTDLAGNPNASESSEVVLQNENYIAGFTARNKYMQSGDTLLADILFKPNYPASALLLQLSLQTADGRSIFTTTNIVDIRNNAIDISFENSKITKRDNYHLLWSLGLSELEGGKYIATVSAQDTIFKAVTVPVSMEFYVLSEAPQVISIKPAGTPQGHYISQKPDFVAEFSSENSDVRIQSAILKFQKATNYQHGTPTEISVYMNETDDPFIWEFNCEDAGVTLAEGTQKVTLTVENQAGMSRQEVYIYNVSGSTVKGIKDLFNYPNPFNALSSEKTIITSMYSGNSTLELYIFDISGRLVYYDKLKKDAPGFGSLRKEFQWDGTGLRGQVVANGVYFARLKAGSEQSDILKIVVNNY